MLDGLQGGHVARGVQVPDREALLVQGRLGEDHTELDLSGVGPPVGVFALSARSVCGHCGYPGAIDSDVQLGDPGHRTEWHHLPDDDRGRVGVDDRCYCLAVDFCAALHPLRGELHPASSASRSRPFLNGVDDHEKSRSAINRIRAADLTR